MKIRSRHTRHILKALNQARYQALETKNVWDQAHVGAVITHGRRVISQGFNRRKTHPRSQNIGNTRHAELDAVLKARTDLEGATCYIARLAGPGARTWAMARPCRHCEWLLRNAGIHRIVYTVAPGIIHSESLIR